MPSRYTHPGKSVQSTQFHWQPFTAPIKTQLPPNLVPIVERRVVRCGKANQQTLRLPNQSLFKTQCGTRPYLKSALFSPIFSLAERKDWAAGGWTRPRCPPDSLADTCPQLPQVINIWCFTSNLHSRNCGFLLRFAGFCGNPGL